MNTTDPEKLKRIVRLLADHRQEIIDYQRAEMFRPHKIDIENCLVKDKFEDAKRLLDLSFTSRQGGQTRKALKNYKKNRKAIQKTLRAAMTSLMREDWDYKRRYTTALNSVCTIEGIGQKIASMFIMFLVYYSKDFKGRDRLIEQLFIPLDTHVCRLLFTKFNKEIPDRINLYDESVNQSYLNYDWNLNPVRIKENKTFRLQRKIQEDFTSLNISEAPVILDYLWYVGFMYCSRGFGDIGCKICFLRGECNQGRSD